MRVKTTNTIFGVIVLLMLLLIIKILCYWQIKEHFYNTNDVVRIADEISTPRPKGSIRMPTCSSNDETRFIAIVLAYDARQPR